MNKSPLILFLLLCLVAGSQSESRSEKPELDLINRQIEGRALQGSGFSLLYQGFQNITQTFLVSSHLSEETIITCGSAVFNQYQSNSFVGIVNQDGSPKQLLSYGAREFDNCIAISQKKNQEIIALGNSNSEETLNDLMLTVMSSTGEIREIQSLGSKYIDNSGSILARKRGGYVVTGTRTTDEPNEKVIFMIEFNEQDQVLRAESSRIEGQSLSVTQAIEDQQQNIWMCGQFSSVVGQHSFVAKFSQDLDVEFFKEIKSDDGRVSLLSLAELGDSIILTGNILIKQLHPFVMSLTKSGTEQWSKSYQPDIQTIFDYFTSVATTDTAIVVGGSFWVNEFFLMKLTVQGEIEWVRTFYSPYYFPLFPAEAFSLQIMTDQSILASGVFNHFDESEKNGFLLKVSPDGSNQNGMLTTTSPPFDYQAVENTESLTLQVFRPVVEDLDLTINQKQKRYDVFSLDFQDKKQRYLYSLLPNLPKQESKDKFRVPFYTALAVSGVLVLVVLGLLACKLNVCKWFKKKTSQQESKNQANASVIPIKI